MAEGIYTVTVDLQYRGDDDLDDAAQLQAILDTVNDTLRRPIQIPPTVSYDQQTHGDPSFEAD